MTDYIALAALFVIAIVLLAVHFGAWGDGLPRWGQE